MTLPYERHCAVISAREFLVELACGEIKRIPAEVRDRARRLLKHYPSPIDLDRASEAAPDVFMRTGEAWHERTFGGGVSGAGGT
jgi:hypothetical protein